MEKQSKLKNKIFKIIPKAAAAVAVTFQNPPFSPGRDHKLRSENAATRWVKPHAHGGKGFSGPIVSMIPNEARRKAKDGGIETQEPTSPKISCMGQIKHKKKQIKKDKAKTMSLPTQTKTRGPVVGSASSTPRDTEEKKRTSKLQRMFFHTPKPKTAARKPDASASDDRAPPLGEMRRFASGRETFSNFDWKAQIAPEEIEERDCYSDDDRVESDAEEDVIIPFSAPIMLGGGGGGPESVPNLQPRKEINLWKRRTMAPPRPLQLNPVLTAK
ncbi:uncharacterized protein At1g76070-like [Abrus precatorius]|uniref:Uncharacterized protein At1g76070-like n=1 Tax=Abrus precatorius TaxID=3816 RepID=A0A8B8JPQ1_ABRPR|nr:uncharacterized protein At1g76070-like [Abrus precatorius]